MFGVSVLIQNAGLADVILTKSEKRSRKESTLGVSNSQISIYLVRAGFHNMFHWLIYPTIVFPQDLTYGYYNLHKKHGDPKKPLDWAIVEATAITEEGHIVPGRLTHDSPT